MDKARLKSIPLFANLDDHDLGVVATFATQESFSDGDVLVREGDYSYELLVIEEGTAQVSRGGEIVATLGPGDFFGEAGVLENSMRNATVVATSGMLAIALTTFDIKRLRNMPGVMEKIGAAARERSA